MTAPTEPRSELTPEQEATVAAHVAEFARLCALPGADCAILERFAAEGAERLRGGSPSMQRSDQRRPSC